MPRKGYSGVVVLMEDNMLLPPWRVMLKNEIVSAVFNSCPLAIDKYFGPMGAVDLKVTSAARTTAACCLIDSRRRSPKKVTPVIALTARTMDKKSKKRSLFFKSTGKRLIPYNKPCIIEFGPHQADEPIRIAQIVPCYE